MWDLVEIEKDPFGLREEAKDWLEKEMVPHGDETYLLPANHYRPLIISETGAEKIPPAQFQKAAAEYEKRISRKDSGAVLPVLVAVGVKDFTFRYFLDDETGPMKKASYDTYSCRLFPGKDKAQDGAALCS